MLPTVPPDELARRLHLVYPGGPLDQQLESALSLAEAMLSGHVDEVLVTAQPILWGEACTELAVKIWDVGVRGVTGMDAVGEFAYPSPTASAGLVNSVAALWHPLTLTGGNVVA
jgi:hypothetical protein